jgi:hypothetical protein
MGKITTRENSNKTLDLEITYGGLDSPFGGIDSSKAPMYIQSNCFTDASNFLVLNDLLVAVGWVSSGIQLQGWVNGMVFLDSGTLTSNQNSYNWALAYQTTANGAGPPAVIDIQYTVWVWGGGTVGAIPISVQCTVRQFGVVIPATAATATLLVEGLTATVAGSVSITVDGGATLPVVINIGDTPAVVAANITAAINAAVGYPCSAVVDSGFSNQIDLTATFTGVAGNNMSILIAVAEGGGGTVPVTVVFQGFTGALSAFTENYGLPIYPTTYTQIGETLYLSGTGTVILQLAISAAGLVTFQPITQYLGAKVLGKYNDQLLAIGIVPGPGQNIQAPEMILAWSASNQFGLWNPLYSNGTVTGAGFNQIADISDYLTGLFICPGVALIIRAQGLDYITPLSNGPSPFDFQHISNALRGEGCQDSRLVTQYDQVGFFIGNSDVYSFTGSLSTIGANIKDQIIAAAKNSTLARDAASGVFLLSSYVNVLALFQLSRTVYSYCPNNKTWMILPLGTLPSAVAFDVTFLATSLGGGPLTQSIQNFVPTLATQSAANLAPTFWTLEPGVQNIDFPYWTIGYVVFPQEEIAFGRDITIESLLVNCAGVAGQVINFSVSGILTGQLVLPVGASPNVFVDYQVYFTSTQSVMTVKNPQLKYEVPFNLGGVVNPLYFAKIAMFGSFDPAQRPV